MRTPWDTGINYLTSLKYEDMNHEWSTITSQSIQSVHTTTNTASASPSFNLPAATVVRYFYLYYYEY